jgi:3-oxoacyl-[acyl-carrier-protein] synthase-1
MRFVESTIMDKRFDPFVLAEVPDDGLPDLHADLETTGLTSRERRLLQLGTVALAECLAAFPDERPVLPLTLALPEMETKRPGDPDAFLRNLNVQAGSVFEASLSEASHRGRAGGLSAIGQAAWLIQSGQVEFAVAGGVDSYRDLFVLGKMDAAGRVKSRENLDGFIPGEGCACLLLGTMQDAAAAGLSPIAVISLVAEGMEHGHLGSEEPYRGDGLSDTVRQLVQSGVVSGPITEVYSSMNGESHWAKEWGVTFSRNHSAFREDHGMHHPADCTGDTGAASGPLMVGMASLGVRDGYRASPALVYASSDTGARTALVVATP